MRSQIESPQETPESIVSRAKKPPAGAPSGTPAGISNYRTWLCDHFVLMYGESQIDFGTLTALNGTRE